MTDVISRQQVIDALRDYLVEKRCPDDGTLTCRLIENEVINKLPPAEPKKRGMSIEQEKMIVESLSSLYPMQKFEEDAIEAVLDALPRWIPCSERLPKKHGAYIVCYSDFRHDIYYGRVIAVAWFDSGDTWLKYRYADNARTFPPKLHYVIAWMPLPEPYKGVNT